jgi:diguanylate cyclase (GGDEF)-like protein
MADEPLQKRIAQLEQDIEESRAREKVLGDLLEKKLNEIYTHYHISRTIGSLLDLQEMLRQVTGIIKKDLPADRISVYLLDEKKEKLELIFFSGLNIQHKLTLKIGEGTPGRIVENGEHVHIHDLSVFYKTFNDFIHFPEEEKRDGSYIGIALKVHNAPIGVIGMDSPVKYGLSVEDMDFLAILSHQIAAGIEKSRLFEKIQQLSQLDGLTGLYNQRVFHDKLRQEINRLDRTRKPLSLLMLDIDHFKQFNDSYGHQAGDIVLRQLARIIVAQCRCASIDVCCRYGGEEFAIIMPELEMHNAVKAAERLRSAVERAAFGLNADNPEGKVTVSIGVAGIMDEDDISPEELVKKADEALYLSKKNGRNQVSYSPGTDGTERA